MSDVSDELVGPLLKNICDCKGTAGYLHEKCFVDWLKFRCKNNRLFGDNAKYAGVSRCEVCNGRYDVAVFCNAYISQVNIQKKKRCEKEEETSWFKTTLLIPLIIFTFMVSVAIILCGPGIFIEFIPKSIIIFGVFAFIDHDHNLTNSRAKLFIVVYAFCNPISQYYLDVYRKNFYERLITWFFAVPIMESCLIAILSVFF
jgi:hypothetical protein